jgi:hypothetical protein
MSFNAFKFVRSDYIRTTAGVFVPTDQYWTNVVMLVRTNPEYTGTTTQGFRTFFTTTISDSTSPNSLLPPSSIYSTTVVYLSPNSPYTTNYPSTDSVYTMALNTYLMGASNNYVGASATSNPSTYPAPTSTISFSNFSTTYNDCVIGGVTANTIGAAITGGFTLECWVYVPTSSNFNSLLVAAQYSVFLSINTDCTVNAQYSPFYNATNKYNSATSKRSASYVTESTSASLWSYTTSTPLTKGSWNHIALTCNFTPQLGSNTGSLNLYINGTRVAQLLNPTASFTGVRTPSANVITIANRFEITGIRFIAGNCLSTASSFTIPKSKVSSNTIGWNDSTSTFTHNACVVSHFSTNGKLLPLIDYSSYKNYISTFDNAQQQQFGYNTIPVINNGTINLKDMYFNGTTSSPIGAIMSPAQQSINTTNSVLGLLNSQNFTVNFFYYRNGTSADYICDINGLLRLYWNTAYQLTLRVSTNTDRITLAAGSANLLQWYYVQFSRTNNGSTSRTYKLTAISSSGTVYTGTDYTAATAADASFSATDLQLIFGGPRARAAADLTAGSILDYRFTAGIVRPTPTTFPTTFHALTAP